MRLFTIIIISFCPTEPQPPSQTHSFSGGSKVIEAVGTTLNTVVRRNNGPQETSFAQAILKLLFSPQKESPTEFYDTSVIKSLNLLIADQITPYFGKVAPRSSLAWLIALHVSNETHDPEMKVSFTDSFLLLLQITIFLKLLFHCRALRPFGTTLCEKFAFPTKKGPS